MIVVVLSAFVAALFLEMFSLISKSFKQIIIFTCSLVIAYLADKYQIDFMEKMNLTTWILLVIIFDQLLIFILKKLNIKD